MTKPAERDQTQKMKELLKEWKELKEKIFKDGFFVVMEDTPEQKRYDQLFQFFYPPYRTKDFVNPLN